MKTYRSASLINTFLHLETVCSLKPLGAGLCVSSLLATRLVPPSILRVVVQEVA